jgi:serine phosphatase RsbU (regulator of sigma subunit)
MLAYEMVRVMSTRLSSAHDAAIRDLQEKNRRLSEAYEALKAAQAQIIEKERLERELKVAHDIQMSLLPRALPRLEGFDFGARLIPARAVGGDLYDFIPLSANQVGVVIGDVTDKGVPAAIFMAQAHALLRAEASRAASPREALQRANEHLLDMNARGLFVTVLYGVLDRVSRTFTYARAGHELPLLCGTNGIVFSPPEGASLPLGIFNDPPLDEQTVELPPGRMLLLYTDGVTDARNAQRQSYGLEKLQAMLQRCAGATAQGVCDVLLQDVISYFGAAPQHDDVAVVALRASSTA